MIVFYGYRLAAVCPLLVPLVKSLHFVMFSQYVVYGLRSESYIDGSTVLTYGGVIKTVLIIKLYYT